MANVNKVKREPVMVMLDKERQLKFTLNSFSEMEERYGSIDDAVAAMEKGSIKAIRFMLWCGLTSDDETLTEKQVGGMIELQDLEELAQKMNQVMGMDMPEKSEGSSPNVVPLRG
jgi:hypothetical protein